MGEVSKNNAGSFEKYRFEEHNDFQVTINSVQQTLHVERLPDPMRIGAYRDILPYDVDNLYPNKIKAMAERSQSCKTAILTETRFVVGQGFSDENLNDLIVNSEGQTLKDLLYFSQAERSTFKGLALHFNYNIFGEIIEINEICFESLRFDKDMRKIVFKRDWSNRSSRYKNPEIHYHLFNPENAVNEINECGGLDKYNGQVLYWIPRKKEIYTTCRFDHALDDVQFEHESGLYKLRNIQNDYSAGYILKYPKMLESEKEKQDLKREQNNSRGAKNAGKINTFPIPPAMLEKLGGMKFVEEIPRTGVDKMFTKQNEETRFNIYAAFQQPPILNGITKDGMFNQESFVDAFDYYNSITESDRKQIEKIFKKFLPLTIWGIENVEIRPLEYISRKESSEKGVEDEEEAGRIKREAQANLKGTVGGVDGILSIQEKVAMGVTQYDAGLEILMEIYGFEEEKAKSILGKKNTNNNGSKDNIDK